MQTWKKTGSAPDMIFSYFSQKIFGSGFNWFVLQYESDLRVQKNLIWIRLSRKTGPAQSPIRNAWIALDLILLCEKKTQNGLFAFYEPQINQV